MKVKDQSVDSIYHGLVDASLKLNSLRSRAALRPQGVGKQATKAMEHAERQLDKLKGDLSRVAQSKGEQRAISESLESEWLKLRQYLKRIEEQMMA